MNKDKKRIIIIVVISIAVLAAAGGIWIFNQKKAPESVIKAMYVTNGEEEDSYIFVDLKTNSVFTITFPEDQIYGEDGKMITRKEIVRGNVVKLHGNGIMLPSYPGQYPGVTKVEVIKAGKPSDADQFDYIMAGIYVEPDPAEKPLLTIEYTTKDAIATVSVPFGFFTWTYETKDKETKTDTADSPHVMERTDIIDVSLPSATDLKLMFSEKPNNIKIVRWDEKLREGLTDVSQLPAGEKVEATEKGGEMYLLGVTSGSVYQITAEFDQGTVEYGFFTK